MTTDHGSPFTAAVVRSELRPLSPADAEQGRVIRNADGGYAVGGKEHGIGADEELTLCGIPRLDVELIRSYFVPDDPRSCDYCRAESRRRGIA